MKHKEIWKKNYFNTSKSNCLTPVTNRKPIKEPEGKRLLYIERHKVKDSSRFFMWKNVG